MGLTYSSVIDAGQDEVFSWHTRPGAVTRLLPPWQPVRVLHEAGSLRDGRGTLTLPGGLRWVATHQPDAHIAACHDDRALPVEVAVDGEVAVLHDQDAGARAGS